MSTLARVTAVLPRPLDPVRSIKTKLGLLVLTPATAGFTYFTVNRWFPPVSTLIAISLSLIITYVLANGTTRPLREMTAAARAMARGDYSLRVRATSRDEVGELAQAFNQMSADLGAADRHRRELIANVSHELRTPITALRAVLENMVDGVAPADPTTLRTALAQTERLGRLVTELLDLSRIDAGVHALQLAEFDVRQFVDEVVAEGKVHAAGAGYDVWFSSRVTPAQARVVADRDRLKQVVLNLLDNATRHSPPGAVVDVNARSGPDGLVLEVRDRGPGIPVAERERVLERFIRGERATGGGTGLGLAIARWVVDLHDGGIAVADLPPHQRPGCLIRVTLPGARISQASP